jgi:peptidoglycan/xylan/chitin deacetylase (PgdA/CDA1 family)
MNSNAVKRSILNLALSPRITPLWAPLTWNRVAIFTLHRFLEKERGVRGDDPEVLRDTLERLRRRRYNLIDLEAAIHLLSEPSPHLAHSVVFTIDDGYWDSAAVAAEIFLAYDCPVSIFLTTGFIDGKVWLWWDQVEFLCLKTKKETVDVRLGADTLTLTFGDEEQRFNLAASLWSLCKRVSESEKQDFIQALSAATETQGPSRPPPQYAPMSWDDARRLEKMGVRFGPHSVTHPVLARTSHLQAEREIIESWERLKHELENPLPVFAYPNGESGDFGQREFDLLRQEGLRAALSLEERYASRSAIVGCHSGRYSIPRFGYSSEPDQVCFVASGAGRIANRLRRIRIPGAILPRTRTRNEDGQ